MKVVGPIVLALIVIGAVSATTSRSWADTTADRLEDERSRAEEIEAGRAAALDALSDTRDALARFEDELASTQADLEVAERTVEETEAAAREAAGELEQVEGRLRDAERHLADNEVLLGSLVRDTYMYGHSTGSPQLAAFDLVVGSETVDTLANGLLYLERGLGARTAAIEQAEALQGAVHQLATLAEQHAVVARRRSADAVKARDAAAAIHAQVDGLLAQTSVRLDQQARNLEQLEREQADAASSIDVLEQQLERERAKQLERESAERRERERAEQRAREQGSSGPSVPAAPAGAGGAPPGGLVEVEGITVAASLGPALDQLLSDARADGIVLGGSGWRSSEVQAALRRTNGCPDVYDSPASSCRVPTARPGTSEHEKGLAVDFTWQGRTICYPSPVSACRGNAAFDWLQANAARYGLYVLPSEAWHWSTTGR